METAVPTSFSKKALKNFALSTIGIAFGVVVGMYGYHLINNKVVPMLRKKVTPVASTPAA